MSESKAASEGKAAMARLQAYVEGGGFVGATLYMEEAPRAVVVLHREDQTDMSELESECAATVLIYALAAMFPRSLDAALATRAIESVPCHGGLVQ